MGMRGCMVAKLMSRIEYLLLKTIEIDKCLLQEDVHRFPFCAIMKKTMIVQTACNCV